MSPSEPTASASEPTASPSEPTAGASEPTASASEPTAGASQPTRDPSEPVLHFAFEARVAIGPSERIGHGVGEELWFTPITGGTVDGPRLRGEVVPGGGDWSTKRGDATELDARYLLRADDGALIDIVNRGFWRATAAVEARLEAGEPVDDGEFYYRTQPVFRTDAPAHRWLAETVFVGLAREEDGHVCIRFYALD